ncbi:hypothetical protein [Paraburkholderia sp. BR13444]|uniref:hypothetical protein n=1 Tax=Paraburkholderia TaxID=1822464 RepID=UPI0034CF5F57
MYLSLKPNTSKDLLDFYHFFVPTISSTFPNVLRLKPARLSTGNSTELRACRGLAHPGLHDAARQHAPAARRRDVRPGRANAADEEKPARGGPMLQTPIAGH